MVDQKQSVLDWLNAGACWKAGVLLFKAIFGAKHPFISLIRKGGSQVKFEILKQALTLYANRLVFKEVIISEPKKKFREEFSFLNENNCPAELKILAADKITAYYNYKSAHQHLFDCTSNDEQLATAKQVVENYIANRRALKELEHYSKHKDVLGKHPVFKLFQRIKEFRQMKFIDLVKLRKNLDFSIWRIQSEINKGDRSDLLDSRLKSMEYKKQELAEIDRILNQHA